MQYIQQILVSLTLKTHLVLLLFDDNERLPVCQCFGAACCGYVGNGIPEIPATSSPGRAATSPPQLDSETR